MRAIAIIAALGVAGGALFLVLRGDDESEPAAEVAEKDEAGRRGRKARGARGDGPRHEPGARHDGTLEQRVERLENEVATLRKALAIRGRVAMAGGGGDRDAAAAALSPDDPVLEDTVRDIYEEEREREREEQRERRRERFDEFRTAALDDLTEAANLDPKQREQIDTLWTTEADAMLALIEAMRSGDRPMREVRDEMRQAREVSDDAAKALLSDSQFEAYMEARPRGPGGPRGGRRPPPDGPPPRP